MFTIRIRYENLPEIVTRHQLYNLFYARSIQFVKDIIQQQQRYRTSVRFKIKLRKLQCNYKTSCSVLVNLLS